MSVGPEVDTAVAERPVTGGSDSQTLWRRIDRRDLLRTAFVAACAVAVAAGATAPWTAVPPVALAGVLVGCWPILVEAWQDVRHRRMSMELSMLIAIAAAAAIGAWVTALIVTVFVLAAEILEELSMDRGRDALTDLMVFLPSTVQVRDDGGVRSIALGEVRAGQTVIVSPGGRVPVDGTVAAGRSTVDQSRITGESLPVDLAPGDRTYAGSVNQVGALEIIAEHVGAESSYGQIVEAVRTAQSSPAPAQRLADRLAGYLIYFALGAALLTYLLSQDLRATISVVIVAGACGIAAGTPLAVLGAIGRAARTGAFIKDGGHLEQLSIVDTVIFDKTGTLTEGTPRVIAVQPAAGTTERELIEAAATAELYSEHPLGPAIVRHAHHNGLVLGQPESFDYRPGAGLSARVSGRLVQVGNTALVPDAAQPSQAERSQAGATEVSVAIDGIVVGSIRLADTVRPSARQCVADLHALGLRVVMLTGDSKAAGQAIGAELGIDDIRAELLPTDKLTAIGEVRAAGRTVAMIGDGVNDAPALAAADVGIAIGSGTEIARHSADVILISSDLADLTRTVNVARRARRVVMANFVGTIGIDVVGIALAGFGFLGPVLAAIIHVGSESAFILNSARLAPGRRTRPNQPTVRMTR